MLQINPLGEHAGAEAVGIDLREQLDEETRRRLNDALVEHVALVVRDQTLTAAELARGLEVFGEPMKQNFTAYRHEAEEFVNFVSNTHLAKNGKRVYHSNYWHTDHTNHEEPPKYTALYAVELPKSGGGDTGIVNMRAGYERLPAALRQRITGLKTVNVFQGSASKTKSARYGVSQRAIEDKPVIHPLVRTHPDNGSKAIYLHQGKLEQFVGISPEESQALVAELMETVVRPELVYRHKWRLGDVLIWDDRSTMHMAYADYDIEETRTLYRVLIKGDRPF